MNLEYKCYKYKSKQRATNNILIRCLSFYEFVFLVRYRCTKFSLNVDFQSLISSATPCRNSSCCFLTPQKVLSLFQTEWQLRT